MLSTSLAVEDPSKKDERGRPGTEWYRIKVWGRQAETLSPHLLKGKSILVEGRLSIQTWTDREGHNRYTPEVSADRVVLLGSPGGAQAAAQPRETPPGRRARPGPERHQRGRYSVLGRAEASSQKPEPGARLDSPIARMP